MRKVYWSELTKIPTEKQLKWLSTILAGKKLVMHIPRKHGLSEWRKMMQKIKEEFENGKDDEKES